MAADLIVVGGGSAGCVLAARLSEDDDRSVLLLEGGPDYRRVSELPGDVVDASAPTVDHDGGLVAEADELGRRASLPRARIIGGCSATNGCFALRGAPADYDGWAALGNPGWTFGEVLPYFCRLESDLDFSDEWHGRDGPVPIRRHPPEEQNALQAAFIEAAVAAGHPYVDDHNRPGAVGVGPTPRNVRDGVRMSTALTYLAGARHRPNLTVRGDTVVDRIEVAHGRATGVRLADGEILDAGQVVLAAGAYASPAILARSGIGPADHLEALDIDVVADLFGVGENLVDHPIVAVDLPVAPGTIGPRFQAITTTRSQLGASGLAPDLHLFAAGPFDVADDVSPSGAAFGIVAGLLSPRSEGRVQLRSADPRVPPRITVAHLTHPDDLARMVEATLMARQIARADPLSTRIVGPELAPGPEVAGDDSAGLAASVKARVATYHHPVGTCRMGPDPDDGAVADARGRVHGIAGLHIADASVMPTIPSANTNLPTMMVAERIADWLRAT